MCVMVYKMLVLSFDHQTLRPTYKLLVGVPGSSNAFAIATRLGLNDDIINLAKSNLVKRSEDSEELIRRIEESHHSAAMEERAAKIMSSEAEEIKRKYEAKLERIESIETRAESKVREHAQKIIDRYSKKLDFALEELARQQKDSRRSQSLKKKIVNSIDEMDRVLVEKPEDRSEEEIITGSELSPGKQVKITGINQDGEIVEILDDGKALVMMGQMKVIVPISSLRLSGSKPAPRQIAKETGAKIAFTKAQGFISEISLRGFRVEPALIVLDKYVDDAIAAGVRQIRIVHGKGTGVMRTVVSEYLRTHPCIESYRIGEEGEGGSGVTVALLK